MKQKREESDVRLESGHDHRRFSGRAGELGGTEAGIGVRT